MPYNTFPNYPQYQTQNGLTFVQGEAGAKSYPVAPGATVLLMDSEGDRFFLRSSDASGMPLPLRTFNFKEVKDNAETPYATKQEMEEIKKSLEEIKQSLGGKHE